MGGGRGCKSLKPVFTSQCEQIFHFREETLVRRKLNEKSVTKLVSPIKLTCSIYRAIMVGSSGVRMLMLNRVFHQRLNVKTKHLNKKQK